MSCNGPGAAKGLAVAAMAEFEKQELLSSTRDVIIDTRGTVACYLLTTSEIPSRGTLASRALMRKQAYPG